MLPTTLLLTLIPLVSAHFGIDYPTMRGNSFTAPANQWIWPCANISQENSANNRTLWPLTGGSVLLDVHHPWAPTYVNLGLGNNVTSFNVSLVNHFNQTGNGTFCLPSIGRAQLESLGVKEGTNASIQVIQLSASGAALYNCADITFSSSAQLLGNDQCVNSTGVGGVALQNAGTANASSSAGASASGTGSSGAAASATGSTSGAVPMTMGGSLKAVMGFGVGAFFAL